MRPTQSIGQSVDKMILDSLNLLGLKIWNICRQFGVSLLCVVLHSIFLAVSLCLIRLAKQY